MQKYKLINIKTGESHLCDKVIIDGFDYYVSDGIISNYFYDKTINRIIKSNRDVEGYKDYSEYFKGVIATNNPNIDCPKVVDEVRRMAISHSVNKNDPWSLKSFEVGFNKSQETHPFSEKDMVEFGIWLHDTAFATYQVGGEYIGMWHIHYPDFTYITSKELLEMWKEQQPKIVYYE